VADENRHLKVSGDFLSDFAGVSIKGYFGAAAVATVESQIEELSACCFATSRHLLNVIFAADSHLSVIRDCAFSCCSSLLTICIPSSVTALCLFCFHGCESLSMVTFESPSRLLTIGDKASMDCPSLSSIVIPSPVETLGATCFLICGSLSRVTFENDFKLSRLCESAFTSCSTDMVIRAPSSVIAIFRRQRSDFKVQRSSNWLMVWHDPRLVVVAMAGILFLTAVYQWSYRGI
jgi:hypothetical protein